MFKIGNILGKLTSNSYPNTPKHHSVVGWKKSRQLSFSLPVKKTGIVDGKKVVYLTKKGKFPSLKLLNKVYKKIPDDRKVPVVMESREQYLKEYIKNQEKIHNTNFSKQEKQEYIKKELPKLQNVDARFTTYHNKYINPRVVIFPQKQVNSKRIQADVLHEFGHELLERNKKLKQDWKTVNTKTSPTIYGTTSRDEDFAESYTMYKNPKLINVSNPHTNKEEIKQRMIIIKRDIKKDEESKDSQIFLAKKMKEFPKPQILYPHMITKHNEPDKIFINKFKQANKFPINYVSNVLGHEELHNVLQKEQGTEASYGLDRITYPVVFNMNENKILNSNMALKISKPSNIKKFELFMDKLDKDKESKNTEIFLATTDRGKQQKMYVMPKAFKDTIFLGGDLYDINFNKDENISPLSKMLSHEVLHNELHEIGEQEGKKLDNISIFPVIDDITNLKESNFANPKDLGEINIKKAVKINKANEQLFPGELLSYIKLLEKDEESKDKWGKTTETPLPDFPESFGYKGTKITMSPQQFLEHTWIESKIKQERGDEQPEYLKSYDKYISSVIYKPKVEKIMKGLESNKQEVPIPWLEKRKREGYSFPIVVGHEGRHRAFAAQKLGMKEIPVVIVEKDEGSKDKKEEDDMVFRRGKFKQDMEKSNIKVHPDVYESIDVVDRLALGLSRRYGTNISDMRMLLEKAADYKIENEDDAIYVVEKHLLPKFLKGKKLDEDEESKDKKLMWIVNFKEGGSVAVPIEKNDDEKSVITKANNILNFPNDFLSDLKIYGIDSRKERKVSKVYKDWVLDKDEESKNGVQFKYKVGDKVVLLDDTYEKKGTTGRIKDIQLTSLDDPRDIWYNVTFDKSREELHPEFKNRALPNFVIKPHLLKFHPWQWIEEGKIQKIKDDNITKQMEKFVISDIGNSILKSSDGKIIDIGRYGVWDNTIGKVVETSNDLEYLRKKYNVNSSIVKFGG